MNTKDINTLKQQLRDWEENISEAILLELSRLDRRVDISELSFNPFVTEISGYIDGIYLDKDYGAIIYTSFADTDCKSLSQCMSDNEIDSWGLLGLLDGLKGIKV